MSSPRYMSSNRLSQLYDSWDGCSNAKIPTVASLVPEPVIVGDNVSVDSWDDIQNDVEGPKSVFKRLELFFSCLGYSVGLCNIWRFPYMIHRNGGAFLLPFTIMVVFVGMPLYYLELVVAQFTSRGPIALWEIVPFFKGIGYSMAILSFIVSMYYNVIISWTLLYLFYSMHYHEPWNTCTESSYAPDCINTSNGSLSMNQTTSNDTANANDTQMLKSSFFSDIFFHKTFLKLSDSAEDVGVPQWQISLCLLLVCCFIFVCLLRNIKSFGKVSYFTSTMVIIFLVIFLVKVISDDQSYVDGVKFFISIDWNTIKSSQVWMDAAYEVIFSLGPCLGGLIALASTNDFHNNCYKNALGVVVINSIISVFGGFVAYSLLGHFSQHVVMRPEDSLSRGIGLAFIVYPMALSELPVSQIWAVLFFLMLFLIGLESSVNISQTVVHAFCEILPHPKLKNRAVSSLVVTLLLGSGGILLTSQNGLYLITLLDTYSVGPACLCVGFFECIVIVYIYGIDRLSNDMKAMFNETPSTYWKIMWRFITPSLIIAVLLFSWIDYHHVTMGGYKFAGWSEVVRWSILGLTLSAIILFMIYVTAYNIIKKQSLNTLCYTEPEWGPTLPENREKLQSTIYNCSSQPVLMVRVAIDADEISPTGMMIGAKPDSAIPYGFFLNVDRKDKCKKRNKVEWRPLSMDCPGTPALPSPHSFWEADISRYSRAESHTSQKSNTPSLRNVTAVDEREEISATAKETAADDTLQINKNRIENNEVSRPPFHKDDPNENISTGYYLDDNIESKAVFFLESSDVSSNHHDNDRGTSISLNIVNGSHIDDCHDNRGYSSS